MNKSNYKKAANWIKIMLVILVTALGKNSIAQEKPPVRIDGKITNFITGQTVSGITIEVFKDGTLLESKTTGSNGKYKITPLKLDSKYKLVFSGGGMVSRFIELDLTNIPNEDIFQKGWDIPIDLPLVERVPNVDFSSLEPKRTSIIKHNKSTGELDWNGNEITKYREELEKLLKKIEAEKAKEDVAKQATEKKYTDAIAAADAAMKKNDYETAMKKYQEAMDAKPSEKTVLEQKYAAAEVKYKEFQGAAALQKEYDEFMKAGNDKLAAKDYDNAIASYKQALTKKPNDATANQKIKDAETAKKGELDKQYNDFIARAEKALKEKDYGQAKNFYGEAAKVKPLEPVPGQKIKEIDDLIKKDMENETKYNQALANGNKFVLEKKYQEAIDAFNEALKVRPGDSEATSALNSAKSAKDKADAETANAAKEKKAFDDLVAQADKDYQAKNYEAAIKGYTDALLKFDDPNVKKKKFDAEAAKKKFEEENAAKAEAAAKKAEYDKLISEGTSSLSSKSYDDAIAKFEAAKATGVNNIEADKKINEAKAAKAAAEKDAQAKLDAEKKKADFDKFMADGDGKLSAKEFDNAIAEYTKALALKVDDATANKKIADAKTAKAAYEKEQADKLAADAAAKKKSEFDAFVSAGDGKLSSKEFDNAIAEYKKALALKVDDAAANAKIKEATDAKAAYEKELADKNAADAAAKKKAEFDGFVAAGDGKLSAKEFDNAVAEYKKALALKVDDASANAKIKEATDAKAAYEKELADKNAADAAAKKKAEFDGLMASGDGKLGAKEFDNAVAEYKKALALKVDDASANAKIKEATDAKAAYEKELADKNAADAAAKKKAEFDGLMASGDGKLSAKEFDNAIAEYKKALLLKVDDAAVNAKIKEAGDAKAAYEKELADKNAADAAAAAAAKKKAEFDGLMASGDTKLSAKDFDKAIADFTKASTMGVDDATAKQKMADATAAKEAWQKEQANAADAAAKKKLYEETIAKAQKDFDAGDFTAAIEKYNTALTYVPDDAFAKGQIEKANAEIEKKKKFAEEQLQKMLDVADKEFNAGNYADAKGYYERYLKQRPDHTYSADKIKECDNKIKESLLNAEQAKKKAEFDAIIAAGDAKLGTKEFDKAIAEYNKALLTKYDDAAANDKIKAATDAKAAYEKELADKNAADAAAKKKAEFDALISAGDTKLTAKDFDKAIADYSKALSMVVDDAVAQQKIDAAIAAKETWQKEQANAADAAAKKKGYDDAIAKAQKDYDAGDFTAAIEKYNTALTFIPDDAFAKGQIEKANAEIEKKKKFAEEQLQKLLEVADKEFTATNYVDAKGYYERYLKQRPDHTHSADRIKECDAKIKELEADAANKAKIEAQYKEFMAKADAALKAKKYDDAIALYDGALGVKSGDATATSKKDEAQRLKDEAASALGKAEQKKKYDAIIAKANGLFDSGNFSGSIDEYNNALAVIPGDEFATKRIALANERMDAKKKEAEEMLNKLLMAADNEFNDKNWGDAKGYYERYLKLKPDNSYAQNRVKECDEKMKEEAASAASKAAMEAKYKKFMDEGEKLAASKKYDEAITSFNSALDVKPGDAPAQKRIDDINKIKNDLFNMAKQQNAAKENQAKYDAAIATGNSELSSANFDPAIAAYKEALSYKPLDKFATEQIKRCMKLKAEKAEANNKMYNDIIKAADDLFNAKNYVDAKGYYERAKNFRPLETYPPKQIEECDKMLNKIAKANKGYELEHEGKIVTGNTVLEGQMLMQEARRQEKYEAEQEYVAINDKKAEFLKDRTDSDVKDGYDKQDMFNKESFERSKEMTENDWLRLEKVDSTVNFIDTRAEEYRGAMHQDNQNSYNRQQDFNETAFYYSELYKGKDQMREYKADSVHDYIDYRQEALANTRHDYSDKNYNKQANFNDFEFNTQQRYIQKDQMREYKADSMKFYIDYRQDELRARTKNNDEANYIKQGNFNETAFYYSELYKGKDQMREYKADSLKFYKDYKEDLTRQTVKNFNEANYVVQANFNESEFYWQQMYKGKDKYREYKADSMHFYVDNRQDVLRQTIKNQNDDNYVKQANFDAAEFYAQQLNVQKDGMREYRADSMHAYVDTRQDALRQSIKTSDKENYNKQANFNDEEFKREQLLVKKDEIRKESVEEVKKEGDELDAFKRTTIKTNAEITDANNQDFIALNDTRSKTFSEKSENYADQSKEYIKVNDNQTKNLGEFKKEGDANTMENNEKMKEASPTVPKVYDNGHLSKLAQDYGEGVHQWTTHKYDAKNKPTEIITRRIVIKGTTANDYMMIVNKWGTNFTKNGATIGEHVWNVETGSGAIIEHDK